MGHLWAPLRCQAILLSAAFIGWWQSTFFPQAPKKRPQPSSFSLLFSCASVYVKHRVICLFLINNSQTLLTPLWHELTLQLFIMGIPQKALDSMKKKVSKWRIFSRTTQVLLTLVVLGLDIFVMEQWSKNQWDFNSAVGNTTNNTYVGGTPFTGIVLFTVSHLSYRP